jgi:hypothetical protein
MARVSIAQAQVAAKGPRIKPKQSVQESRNMHSFAFPVTARTPGGSMPDIRFQASWREANVHAFELSFGMLTMLAAYGSVLAALAYFGVPIAWLIVAGFVFSTVIICNIVIDGIRHLDAGHRYLQQTFSTLKDATDAKSELAKI